MKRHGRVAIRGPKGILVVAKPGHAFNLPGGKAEKGENQLEAAGRERKQELGKRVKLSRLRFHSDHLEAKFEGGKRSSREFHRVYTATLRKNGVPKPRHEIKKMAWVNRANLSKTKLAFPANYVVPKLLGRKWK